jgi:Mrp family chromosome partitioning ATPase/predicted Fe-Mo cluster-binding NifX family protein
MNDRKSEQDSEIQKKLENIDHIIIVLSGKGGVGKSTAAVNLALSLSSQGFKTGILDVDIHGPSIPKLLGLTGKRMGMGKEALLPLESYANISVVSMGFLLDNDEHPVIWRGPIKANMIREFIQHVAWGRLDYLVVDCPPGTGDEPLSVAQILGKKARAVILTTPQEVSIIDVEKCVIFCRQLNLPIAGIIENMSGFICPHCGKETDIFSRGGGEALAHKYGVPFFGKIPLDPAIVKSGDEGRPYVYFYSKTETAKRFDAIATIIAHGGKNAADKQPIMLEKKKVEVKKQEDSMKFAVPTYEGKLCAHFGHCESFVLIDADGEGRVVNETYVNPPPHEPGLLPEWLSQKGVNCVIAGGMGSRAQQLFAQKGIRVITGALGESPKEVVEQYLKGTLQTGANTCDH